jgi:hypothetical protein
LSDVCIQLGNVGRRRVRAPFPAGALLDRLDVVVGPVEVACIRFHVGELDLSTQRFVPPGGQLVQRHEGLILAPDELFGVRLLPAAHDGMLPNVLVEEHLLFVG